MMPPSTADKMPEADPPALPTLKTTGWLVPPTVEPGPDLAAWITRQRERVIQIRGLMPPEG